MGVKSHYSKKSYNPQLKIMFASRPRNCSFSIFNFFLSEAYSYMNRISGNGILLRCCVLLSEVALLCACYWWLIGTGT
jgi:hypothetical protein